MKKIFTILMAVGFVSIASAQKGGPFKQDSRKDERKLVQMNSGRGTGHEFDNRGQYSSSSYSFTMREKQLEISRINRLFDQQVFSLNQRRIRPAEKNRQIRFLDQQRDEQIRKIELKYSNRSNRDYVISKRSGSRW